MTEKVSDPGRRQADHAVCVPASSSFAEYIRGNAPTRYRSHEETTDPTLEGEIQRFEQQADRSLSPTKEETR